ncbi:C-X-C chemokine receptor type 3-like [Lethenteron reissneri]|uniref:C-X-C chemokine receptor type 3-like n=1 Tax=Lethenteron reissneri TaxID=7753 RepID=UPI002AB6AE2C|nr:C-X-C chemokine receptor type 3-like [Lethenteron reissneri]
MMLMNSNLITADDDEFDPNYSYDDDDNSTELPNNLLAAIIDVPACTGWLQDSAMSLVPIVYAAVALAGIAGHLPLLLVLARGPRTSTRLHLLHLAACDVLFLAMLPVQAAMRGAERWSHGEVCCSLLGGLFSTNLCGASLMLPLPLPPPPLPPVQSPGRPLQHQPVRRLLMLAALGVDRYLAVVRARGWARAPRAAARRVHATCACAWLAALLMSAPSFANYRVLAAECVYGNGSGKATVRLLQVLGSCVLPGAIMSFCYGSIAWRLLRLRDARRQRALRIVYAAVVAFVSCTLPYNAVALVDVYAWSSIPPGNCQEQTLRFTANLVTEVLAYSHCAIHPVLHACLSRAFRQQLLAMLLRPPATWGRRPRGHRATAAGPASEGGSSGKTELSLSARDTVLVHTVI